jgi:type III secretion system YscI/HrpB-like protein
MDAALGTTALLNAGVSALPNAALPVATSTDVQRFEQAMSGVPVPGTTTPAPTVTPPTDAAEVVTSTPTTPATVGDAILRTFDRLGHDWQAGVDKINLQMKADPERPMASQTMFQLQFDLTMLSMQSDMTARIADRVSQGLQTLFRNQ